MRFLVVANCQGTAIKEYLESVAAHRAEHVVIGSAAAARLTVADLAGYDVVIAQDIRLNDKGLWDVLGQHPRLVHIPALVFFGLTPDTLNLLAGPDRAPPPENNVPRIALAARARGLSAVQAQALYCHGFIEEMGYGRDFEIHRQNFLGVLGKYTAHAAHLFDSWFARGPFFHTYRHPRLFVVQDMLREVLGQQGIALPAADLSPLLPDPLLRESAFPVYNHPRATNRLERPDHFYKTAGRLQPLAQRIAVLYGNFDVDAAVRYMPPHDLERFDAAHAAWSTRQAAPLTNPYKTRPAHNFWARAVARPAPGDVAPGAGLRPVIGPETRVATAGSCFAQHVARAMVSDGLTYYVAEPAPQGMEAQLAQARGYGLFSARYGNIYSTRQLLQLIRRAYGSFTPSQTAWQTPEGFIDPFRPNIGETFESVAALEAARAAHLAQVREMFETLDVFVFTLGLTEGWVDRRCGAAYPVTPGAVTRQADPADFAFENADYPQIRRELTEFLGELARVNPAAQVILTVSPVPLIATYGEDDVLSATTYSKSVLRAVAGDMARDFAAVQYFPSYEIITGAYNRGAYFEPDLRGIRPEGVAHVMGVFRRALVIGAQQGAPRAALPAQAGDARAARIEQDIAAQMDIVCDEELLLGE